MTTSSFGTRIICLFAAFVASFALVPRAARAQAADEFHVGDRIALTIEGLMPTGASETNSGPQVFMDTAVVREGLVLQLPPFGDISVAGVKRADVQAYLTKQIGKYVRNPVVHATPLVRIAVLGEVGHPGFYSVPSDMLLSDVVMHAGGPTGNADLNRTVVKRGSTEILSRAQAQAALKQGETLDQMRIAPGDEIVVGQKSTFGFGTILQVVGVAVSILGLLVALSYNRHH